MNTKINYRLKKMTNVLMILLSFVLLNCSERIDIELDTTYTRLVVEGHITSDTMAHWVRLTKSSDYYGENAPQPASNAIVTMNDGIEIISLNESDTLPGYYQTSEDFFGIPGMYLPVGKVTADPVV